MNTLFPQLQYEIVQLRYIPDMDFLTKKVL